MQAHALIALCITLAALPASAQHGTGVLRGEVRDINGALVAGTRVELRSEQTGRLWPGAANELGAYSFAGLPPGQYTLKLAQPGFKPLTVVSIALAAGEQRTLPVLQLAVAVMGDCTGNVLEHVRLLAPGAAPGLLAGSVSEDTDREPAGSRVLPGAEVVLVCAGGKTCGTTRTSRQGRFHFPSLAPGTYSVRVLRPGFYPLERSGYEVREGLESVYAPLLVERCFRGNCDPLLRPKKPITVCE